MHAQRQSAPAFNVTPVNPTMIVNAILTEIAKAPDGGIEGQWTARNRGCEGGAAPAQLSVFAGFRFLGIEGLHQMPGAAVKALNPLETE
jgi:hypothetical protein